MANTIVQFKRSTANDVPTSLSIGEPAYSFKSGKLFIGNTDSTIIAIGGRYFVDQQNTIFAATNAAFLAANSAYGAANSVSAVGAYNTANGAYGAANAAFSAANSAFASANTKYSASGGTITGTVTITGDLIVSGNTVVTDTYSMNIGDPLIYLAANNRTTDAVDIGWVGAYNTAGTLLRTGMFRDATTKEFYIFDSYTADPAQSNHINPAANGFSVSVLNAAIRTSNLNLGGVNAISWITSVFGATNAAFSAANSGFGAANGAYAAANAGFSAANSAFAKANGAVQVGFPTIVANGNTISASSNSSTLTIIAGTNIGITTNVSNSGIVISDLASGPAFNAANAAFNKANGSQDAANLTSGTIVSARLSGSYTGITGVGTLTAGLWQAGTINVAYGGTGMITFTTNGILYGNGTGSIKVTSAGTDGQVLLADPTGTPIFAMLDGGTF